MPKIQIIGRAIPEYIQLTAPKLMVDWEHEATEVRAKFCVKIEKSKITIDCETNKFETHDERNALLRHAYDLARTLLDIYGFQLGSGLDLTFDSLSTDDGYSFPYRMPDQRLAALSKAAKSPEAISTIIGYAINDLKLATALRHLNEALTAPRRTSVRSAQCIDGIRSLIVPPGGDDKDGWPLLREKLNVTRSYLDVVMDESKAARHGDSELFQGITRSDSVFRAYEIVNRYLEYRKRGAQDALPLAEFPKLS
jgi:hypothetical protein